MAPSLLASPPSPPPPPPSAFLSPPSIQTSTSSSSPVPFDPLSASFRPSIAVIIGVLTTMFSLTFLLLLYAKHCKRAASGAMAAAADQQQANMNAAPPPPPLRGRDSGVDRAVIDALPVFSFASLHGLKDGLECAVCLSRFEKLDLLRLLPKCKHAFHIECVDTWLGSHSTCPLCRNRVEPEDVLIVEEFFNGGKMQVAVPGEEQERQSSARASNYTAGRLSSAAGSEAGIDRTLQLFVQRERDPSSIAACASFRLGRTLSCKKEPSLRKDGDCGKKDRPPALPISAAMADKDLDAQFAQRLWHRIIVSDVVFQHRWSDFMPSDALLLDTQADHQHLSFIPIGLDHRLMMINLNATAQQRLSTSTRTAGDGRMEDSSGNSISSSYYSNIGDGPQASAMADVAAVTDNAPAMALDMELTSTINQSPEGGHINSSAKQAGLLKRALAAGIVSSGSRRTSDSEATLLLMPTRYPRSLSEVSGMKRYADSHHHNSIASAGKSRDDEETKKWLSIARKTLTWLTRQERSSLTSTTRAFQ